MKYKVINVLMQVLSCILTMAIVLGGWAIGLVTASGARVVWIAVCAVLGAIIVGAGITNIVLSHKYVGRLTRLKPREGYEYGQKVKAEIESDYRSAEKQIEKIIRIAYAYLIGILVVAFMCAFSLGRIGVDGIPEDVAMGYTIPIQLLLVFGLWGGVHILLPFIPTEPLPEKLLIGSADYPLIVDTIRKAADDSGCALPIAVCDTDGGISVTRQGKRLIINLDYMAAAFLTRDELYNVMLHEIAHYTNSDIARGDKYARVRTYWGREGNVIMYGGSAVFFKFFAELIWLRTMTYELISSRYHEAEADAAVKRLGDPRVYADALAKGALLYQFEATEPRELAYDFFEPESPRSDYASYNFEIFGKYLETHKELWLKRMAAELPANVDSHPTFNMRLEAMGFTDFDYSRVEQDEAYRAECDKLLKFNDSIIFEQMRPYYYDIREERYASRKRAIEDYERTVAKGGTPSESDSYTAMSAYFGLDDDKALAVADSLLAAVPNGERTNFVKGLILFDHDDPKCVEHFRLAAKNPYYAENALNKIGEFALKTGDKELLADYRATIPDLVQEAYDDKSDGTFDSAAVIETHDLGRKLVFDMIKGILDYGKKNIAKIYICKYTSEDGTVRYPVAVKFKRVRSAEQLTGLTEGISAFLIMLTDSYRLRLYTGGKNSRRIKKTPGSLVYDSRHAAALGL